MSHYNADLARAVMRDNGLIALLAQSPESVQYHTGESGFFNRMLRHGYAAASLDFVDPSLPPAMVVSNFEVEPLRELVAIEDIRTYMTWIAIDDASEIMRGSPVERPVQPTAVAFVDQVRDILRDRGLSAGHIGIEATAMSAAAWELLRESLPGFTLVPSDSLFSAIRAVKTSAEIEILRTAAMLAELGIDRAMSRGVLGATHQDLSLAYQSSVLEYALVNGIGGVTSANPINFNIGPDPFPVAGTPSRRGVRGDIVKLDAGVTVHGYRSDLGRTNVLGAPSADQERLAKALLDGLDAALDMLGPGQRLRDVYWAGLNVVRKAGYSRYARGHIGHAIGLAHREDAPFISAGDDTIAEVGMTFAVELPYYVNNLGAMLFEENVVITSDGWELLTNGRSAFDTLPT